MHVLVFVSLILALGDIISLMSPNLVHCRLRSRQLFRGQQGRQSLSGITGALRSYFIGPRANFCVGPGAKIFADVFSGLRQELFCCCLRFYILRQCPINTGHRLGKAKLHSFTFQKVKFSRLLLLVLDMALYEDLVRVKDDIKERVTFRYRTFSQL